MNINQLRYFQAVCKYNNITKAARELLVAQPSVTVAIKELEKETGLLLFNRIKKKIILTEEGKIFLIKVNNILEKIDYFHEEISEMGKMKKQHIRLCVPQSILTFLFPRLLIEFERLHPEIKLEIFEIPSIKALEQIRDNSIDVAIIILDEDIYDIYETQILFETEIQLCVCSKSPLAICESVSFKELKDIPVILFQEGSYHYKVVHKIYEKYNLKPNVILHSGQLYTIQNFVENNIAATFLVKEIFHKNENIVYIPLKDPIRIKVGMVRKKGRYISQAVHKFIHVMKQIY